MPRPTILEQIQQLDPVTDHQRIVFLSTRYDFPFDTVRALELALFRTFCVPSIALLLDRTGEFQSRAQKRYDDTDLIVSEMMDHGYDSERGKAALRRMNQIHGRFESATTFFSALHVCVRADSAGLASAGGPCAKKSVSRCSTLRAIGLHMNIAIFLEEYELRAFSRDTKATLSFLLRPTIASAAVPNTFQPGSPRCILVQRARHVGRRADLSL